MICKFEDEIGLLARMSLYKFVDLSPRCEIDLGKDPVEDKHVDQIKESSTSCKISKS